MAYSPRPSACEDLTTEDNRTPIVPGMRLFNYYDCKWGVVQAFDPTAAYWNGWFDFVHDDGSRTSLNGVRVSTVDPNPNRTPRS